MDDKITDGKAAGLILGLQKSSDEPEHTIQATATISSFPADELIAVFANDQSEADDTILRSAISGQLRFDQDPPERSKRTCRTSRSSA